MSMLSLCVYCDLFDHFKVFFDQNIIGYYGMNHRCLFKLYRDEKGSCLLMDRNFGSKQVKKLLLL